jgi:hypothetical protein
MIPGSAKLKYHQVPFHPDQLRERNARASRDAWARHSRSQICCERCVNTMPAYRQLPPLSEIPSCTKCVSPLSSTSTLTANFAAKRGRQSSPEPLPAKRKQLDSIDVVFPKRPRITENAPDSSNPPGTFEKKVRDNIISEQTLPEHSSASENC